MEYIDINKKFDKIALTYTSSITDNGTYDINKWTWNPPPSNTELKDWAVDIFTIKKLLIILFEDIQSIKESLEKRDAAEEAEAV